MDTDRHTRPPGHHRLRDHHWLWNFVGAVAAAARAGKAGRAHRAEPDRAMRRPPDVLAWSAVFRANFYASLLSKTTRKCKLQDLMLEHDMFFFNKFS